MKILLTGSAGHLGEALARTFEASGRDYVGFDIVASPFTTVLGSIADMGLVERAMRGVDAVVHTATLHEPHVVTHSRREFVDTNITGTLNLLEAAAAARVDAFVYTSTTSVFGRAMAPAPGAPAVWITEEVVPEPKNIYGVTKKAAEDLCELLHRRLGLPCVVLRTSRFFPDEDDDERIRGTYADGNVKANEYLYRRVDLEDVVTAHLLALERARPLGFGRYIVSATTPFARADAAELRANASAVVRRLFPAFEREYVRRGWRMFPSIDRIYVNERARDELGWRPRHDFGSVLTQLEAGGEGRSPLAEAVGIKGYHADRFAGGMYPTER